MTSKITLQQAEQAIKTLIEWAGEDPDREGLLETPARVARAYREYFSGYDQNPQEILAKTFEEVENYDEMVLVKNIRVESFCEHHFAPIIGFCHVAYIPNKRIVGLSKLARVVDVFAKRLQVQERMTLQIATTINDVLKPKGVAVVMNAIHHCMTMRGVHKTESTTTTSHMLGVFREDPRTRA